MRNGRCSALTVVVMLKLLAVDGESTMGNPKMSCDSISLHINESYFVSSGYYFFNKVESDMLVREANNELDV